MKRNNSTDSYLPLYRYVITVLAVFILAMDVYARAGGGGGGNSGGGGDDGIAGLVFYILLLIPFPYNLLIIGTLILLAYLGRRKVKEGTVLNKMAETVPDVAIGKDEFLERNPQFDETAFLQRVQTSFLSVQKAWSDGNMSPVRRYISDGVYQRFNTQFKMMKQLELTNKLEKIELLDARVFEYDSDGEYDIAHVAISASLVDQFISAKYSGLHSGGIEAFLEYWTYIRRKGIAEKNIYASDNCPQCGAPLPKDMGEVAKCDHCGAITSLGDYDWVLCEITQADDFTFQNRKITSYDGKHINKIRNVITELPAFSVQHIEDKVSNGFLQIQTARVLKNPSMMRRFVSDKLYEQLEKQIKEEPSFIYYRIFLSDVTVTGVNKIENAYNLAVAVKMSYQRVHIEKDRLEKLDYAVNSDTWMVNLTREINQQISKGSLYAFTCPYCGGTLKDTTDIKCPYCGQVLNSPKGEWIITSMKQPDYIQDSDLEQNLNDFDVYIDSEKLDDLLDVRDFAFNNVAVIAAADMKITEEEEEMLRKLAKKWGYNLDKIRPTLDLAISGRLKIRMPDNPKKCQKIIRLMEKAAAIDGFISPEEQAIIDSVKQTYL
jgi:predicted lipid-binding transport protein (Tim44 family)